jgi:hypothetical protein
MWGLFFLEYLCLYIHYKISAVLSIDWFEIPNGLTAPDRDLLWGWETFLVKNFQLNEKFWGVNTANSFYPEKFPNHRGVV